MKNKNVALLFMASFLAFSSFAHASARLQKVIDDSRHICGPLGNEWKFKFGAHELSLRGVETLSPEKIVVSFAANFSECVLENKQYSLHAKSPTESTLVPHTTYDGRPIEITLIPERVAFLVKIYNDGKWETVAALPVGSASSQNLSLIVEGRDNVARLQRAQLIDIYLTKTFLLRASDGRSLRQTFNYGAYRLQLR